MSTPQLISPLLDGFVMGDPISSHDGVNSCPAMELETDQKYIVKIISVPASQAKLDALLLAGAYTDRESAQAYFKDLADGVVEEAELLRKLSKHEGFISFDNWQMVPMEDGETGYDIYLLGAYRPTVASILKANDMTHLAAVNLGLDLCAALTVARRFGYLYSNLRPSNIYVCNEREFRIGDLGFLSMESLPYASLPDKYRSDYTPPEISDAYSALNETMDTYAVGLILYQAYNDGQLPPVGYSLEAPRHADYDLSQIILKACATNPEDRWQDPIQMGQALVNYMQINNVNDTPIAPVIIPEEPEVTEEPVDEESAEPTTDDILAEVDHALEAAPEIIAATSPDAAENTSKESDPSDEVIIDEAEAQEETILEEAQEEEMETAESDAPEEVVETEASDAASETEMEEESEADSPVETEDEIHETDEILAQADELIAHQLPDPVVVPEAIEVTLPELPDEEPAAEDIPEETETETKDQVQDVAAEEFVDEESDSSEDEDNQPRRKKHRGLALIAVICVLAILVVAGGYWYENFYLQTINGMSLSGNESYIAVTLDTNIADERLTVRCSDTHGNSQTQSVENGVATFIGLQPGTKYTFEVRIEGFHKLVGETTCSYTTSNTTVVDGFYATTGPEDGSVILSFSIQGPDSTQWTITYSAADEESRTDTFTGHMVTLSGLTIGKTYTFSLAPVTELHLSGERTISYIPREIVYAKDLQILSFADGQLRLSWANPDGMEVAMWHIRCYNEHGFDQTLSTASTEIAFEALNPNFGYTIEVTADGMTLGARTYLTPSSLTIQNIHFNTSDRNHLKVTWECIGDAPKNGWLLLYTIDGSSEQLVVKCSSNHATITPLIPGAHYAVTIQAADGTTLLDNTAEFDAPQADPFSGYLIDTSHIKFYMCKTQDISKWDGKTSVNTYSVGVSASFIIHATQKTEQVNEEVVTLYVIRDSKGNLISNHYETRTWDDMWNNRYGKLTIPVMPKTAGKYTVEIYFNGAAVSTQSFTIKK